MKENTKQHVATYPGSSIQLWVDLEQRRTEIRMNGRRIPEEPFDGIPQFPRVIDFYDWVDEHQLYNITEF